MIAEAARRISRCSGVGDLRASRLFQTPPIGGPGGQEPFLNAVAACDTTLSARELLAILQATENELGRHRRARWGARSIDVDVVLHGALVGGGQGLIVPHPRYTARMFVLRPACDVAAHYRDPRFGWTLERLAEHVTAAPPSLALIGDSLETRIALCARLTQEHGLQTFHPGPLSEPMAVVGNAPAALPRADQSPVDSGRSHRGAPSPEDAPVSASIEPQAGQPWISAFVPPLPPLDSAHTADPQVPRLVARLQRTTPETRWPAPHQMWPAGWQWPEYRLEVTEFDWAVKELASATDSMRCPLEAVTDSGDWWH